MEFAEAIRRARRVYLIGNGGSYANAVHIANDLLSVGIKAYTLDAASLTASANDFGYETVFERWLSVVGEKGDLLIALSGSGKSPNILKAIEAAERIGMDVWKVFGAHLDMQSAENEQVRLGHEAMLWLK
jgi:D-sedoheptulose 7-phosphate isomerase